MEFIKWGKIPRLNRDIIITEKIDGTNAQVYITPVKRYMEEDFEKKGWKCFDIGKNITLGIVPGSRNRFLNLQKDNFGFCKWVGDHAEELLGLGIGRHFGEWWGKGIQRTYDMDHKEFSMFHFPNEDLPECCSHVPILYHGSFGENHITMALEALRVGGSTAVPGYMKPEGIVIFHLAGNKAFKVTLENDAEPKGKRSCNDKI